MSNDNQSFFSRWFFRCMTAIGLLTTLLVLLALFGPFKGKRERGNVAHLKFYGPITTLAQESSIYGDPYQVISSEVLKTLEKIQEESHIKGILLEINSPGGTPVASEEIARALKASPLPTVAWIREIGTSGAYWIAASTDHIVAHPLSITGSIGVLANQFGFENLIKHWHIDYRRQVAGQMKDLGDPFRAQTEAEKQYMQSLLDSIHEAFMDAIESYRELPDGWRADTANGLFFLGQDAVDRQLVDELGSRQVAETWLENKLGESIQLEAYSISGSLLENLFLGVRHLLDRFAVKLGEGLAGGLVQDTGQVPFRT